MKRKTNFLKNMAAASLLIMSAAAFMSCDDDNRDVAVTGISVEPATLTLAVGAKQTLEATVLPENVTDKTLTWTSSAANIAAVNAATGEVTALAEGRATITAACGGRSANCIVTVVTAEISVTDIRVEPAALTLAVGEKQTLAATVLPEDATNKTLTWTSSNTAVATVDEHTGEVTAVAVGNATVTVTAEDGGKTADCAVTVNYAEGTYIKLTLLQYESPTVTVKYVSGNSENLTKQADGTFHIGKSSETIKSIMLSSGSSILTGRKTDIDLTFKVSGTGFAFRDAVEDTIPVGSYAEFQLINKALNGKYKQEADIDLLSEEWTPIGKETNPFTGTFDGNFYTLANIKIDQPDKKQVGLFGAVGTAGYLKNISVVSGSVVGDNETGGICGRNTGIVERCGNAASISADSDVGGICGWAANTTQTINGTIISCYNKGDISGISMVGGICGYDGNITACYNTGNISGSGSGSGGQTGGIAGHSSTNSYVKACYNKGTVSGSAAGYPGSVGGIIGLGTNVSECYNTGALRSQWGSTNVGGIIGYLISNQPGPCYWYNVPDDDATTGVGNGNYNILTFGLFQWPSWGIGDGSGDGKWWKSMGGWDIVSGNHVYPSLWFE